MGTDKKQKIAEFGQGKERGVFDVNPQNKSVSWHIPKLNLNDNGSYWASLMEGSIEQSELVNLTVQQLNTSSTGRILCRVFKKLHE